ncbi:MAG: type II toxin-antitoxin system YafQ family toxin [Lachnospiraceae bacterium]|nr:type II toxin-antitoxin system YafQ family toxin [Lachnospiraceae bacterium]
MLRIQRSTRFKKDFKRIVQQPCYDEAEFKHVVDTLVAQKPLEEKYRDHPLKGKHAGIIGCRECHIKPDWILVYKVYKEDLILYLIETDSHSNTF